MNADFTLGNEKCGIMSLTSCLALYVGEKGVKAYIDRRY